MPNGATPIYASSAICFLARCCRASLLLLRPTGVCTVEYLLPIMISRKGQRVGVAETANIEKTATPRTRQIIDN